MEKMHTYELCQTYIRFDFKADKEFKAALEKYLLYKGKKYAKEYFHKELVFDEFYFTVETEDGSLKSRLKIYGKIVLTAVIVYGGARTGIDYLIEDARNISEHIARDIANERNIDPNSIGRVERRLGVPGQLKRLYEEIEYLSQNRDQLQENEQQQILGRISRRYEILILQLDQPEVHILQNSLQQRNIPYRLPAPQPDPDDLDHHLQAIREEEVKLINQEDIEEAPALPPPIAN